MGEDFREFENTNYKKQNKRLGEGYQKLNLLFREFSETYLDHIQNHLAWEGDNNNRKRKRNK